MIDVTINDVVLTFHGDYHPEESSTWEYPGCDEEFSIRKITYKGQDVTDLVLGLVDHFELEKKCLEAIANQANMFDESD